MAMTPYQPAAETIADLRAELAAHDADPMREHPEWVESRARVVAALAEVEADPAAWDRRYQAREARRITHESAHWREPLVALFGFER